MLANVCCPQAFIQPLILITKSLSCARSGNSSCSTRSNRLNALVISLNPRRSTPDIASVCSHTQRASYRDSLLWQNTLHLDAANQLLLGAEWTEERLRANVPLEERERRNQAWFVQHRYRAAPFGTELGLRHDQDRQFGNEDQGWLAHFMIAVSLYDAHLFP